MKIKALLFEVDDVLSHPEAFHKFWASLRALNAYRLVLLSNPHNTERATLAQLEQAQLPTSYDFITGCETMLFERADPSFYIQIVAQLGIEPDESLILSTSGFDLAIAQQVNIYGYTLVNNANKPHFFDDFVVWLTQQPSLPSYSLAPHSIIPNLSGNLGALTHLVHATPLDYWHQRPEPHEWSILQILTHLIESEVMHQLPRLQQIVEYETPFISAPKPPGPDLPAKSTDALALLSEFTQLRQQTLAYIQKLAPSMWTRTARHSVFGMTTLLEMAYFTARHDRLHIQQLCQTIGKCHEA